MLFDRWPNRSRVTSNKNHLIFNDLRQLILQSLFLNHLIIITRITPSTELKPFILKDFKNLLCDLFRDYFLDSIFDTLISVLYLRIAIAFILTLDHDW